MQTLISKIGSQPGKLISNVHIKELEEWINDYTCKLPPVEHFIIPVSYFMYFYSDNLVDKYIFNYRENMIFFGYNSQSSQYYYFVKCL